MKNEDWMYRPKLYLQVVSKYKASGWGSRNIIWNCDEVLQGEDHKIKKKFGMVGELNKKLEVALTILDRSVIIMGKWEIPIAG